eukprot:GFYU01006002.1.p1 GENE.GFYU01006002.1~~GFYU01006002.1.p1  ORF type:complete len:276 (-),score=63.83 GFYU01006002.1:86-913(-)
MDTLSAIVVANAAVNIIGYAISAPSLTEKYYDGMGSLAFQASVFVGLFYRNGEELHPNARQVLAAAFVLVWTWRLGIMLFRRASKVGDSRFDGSKANRGYFAVPWILQILWVFMTAFPVWVVLANDSKDMKSFGEWSDIVGIVIWVYGFLVEAIADYQKSAWKEDYPKDPILTGLWYYSRHPNYCGEWTLWLGQFFLAMGGFTSDWNYVSVTAVVFTYMLLRYGSGVVLTEKSQNKRYGDRPEWQRYMATTSVFFLWFKGTASEGNIATDSESQA